MNLYSPSFLSGEPIPKKYTCDGEDISPPLFWENVPEDVKSYALICVDPDAPSGTWVHWLVWNIPREIRELPEGFGSDVEKKINCIFGTNDFGRTRYGGPCPPYGRHRYFFTLYGLNSGLSCREGSRKEKLLHEMEGRILGSAQIMGTYHR